MTTVYIKSSGIWYVPSNVTKVSVTLYGGGAGGVGGLYCAGYTYGGYAGDGGKASIGVTTNDIPVIPGTAMSIVIGSGGAGGLGKSTCSATNGGYWGNPTTFPGAADGLGADGGFPIHAGNYGYPGIEGAVLDGLSPGSTRGQNDQYGGAGSIGYGAGGGGGGQNGTSMGYNGGAGAAGVCVITYTAELPAHMVLGALTISPPITIVVGGTVTASQVVTNDGGSPGSVRVIFSSPEGYNLISKTATIAAGGTEILTASYETITPGDLSVCARLGESP